jgi:hypothetical protein
MKAKRTPTPAPNPEPYKPADIPAHHAAARSRANRDLLRLLQLLRDAGTIAAAWLDAGHGYDCRCDFCGYAHRLAGDPPSFDEGRLGARIEHDVRGIMWTADMGESALESVVLTPPQPKQVQPPQRPKRSPKRVKK